MKKVIALVLALTMVLGMSMTASAETAGMKIGMAIVTSISSSKDATADADGNARVDGTVVAVLMDAEGKLVDAAIDVAQTQMAFSAAGAVVTPFDTEFKTKREFGDDYGMKAASSIGKEWYEQVSALCQYTVGKTVDEIKGFALDDVGHSTDADLLAGVTIKLGAMKDALIAAMEGAVDCNAAAGDKLGLGVATNMEKSKDAAADADGQCQAYSTYAAVAVNADGVVTGCLVNAVQGNVKFDAAGKITSDLTAAVADKKTLGDSYGMKAASGIGKEWYEQAAGFEAYVTGKTAAELEGIAVDETGHPTDADLTASVTVGVVDLKASVLKAIADAQ